MERKLAEDRGTRGGEQRETKKGGRRSEKRHKI